jgi:hypothetical protein
VLFVRELGPHGTAMYLLLGGQVSYTTTLGVLLAASMAGVLTPIPRRARRARSGGISRCCRAACARAR